MRFVGNREESSLSRWPAPKSPERIVIFSQFQWLSCNEAKELLAICAVLFRKVFVTKRLEVLEHKSCRLDGATKNIGIEKVDEWGQAVAPVRGGDQLGVEGAWPRIALGLPALKLGKEFHIVAEL